MKVHGQWNFVAIKMSGGEDDEYWFETEGKAWEYIYSRSCEDCKKNPKFDACSAEWSVWTRDFYNECKEDVEL